MLFVRRTDKVMARELDRLHRLLLEVEVRKVAKALEKDLRSPAWSTSL
jgi:hypothetical protein